MTLLAQDAGTVASQGAGAEAIVFWVFAVIGLGAGIAMITMKNIVHAALMLVLNFLAIAALYLALQSQFLGIIQIIVYAGAIMVLFLFVIMLLGVDRDDLLFSTKRWHRLGAAVAGVAIAAGLLFAFSGSFGAASRCGTQAGPGDGLRCAGLEQALDAADQGSVGVVAERMFQRYTFPFEAAALLLVVATIGALILGRRHDPAPEDDAGVAVPPELAMTPPAPAEGAPSDADRLLPPGDPSGRRDEGGR